MSTPRTPSGLQAAGKKLFKSINAEFDFSGEPGKLRLLFDACRVADVIAELDEAANEAPLTVKGSMGQQVISPFIAEGRAQRALLAQLLSRLDLPDTDEAIDARQDELSRKRAQAGRRFRLA